MFPGTQAYQTDQFTVSLSSTHIIAVCHLKEMRLSLHFRPGR